MKVNRRFGGIFRLHFQGRILTEARNHREAGSKQIPDSKFVKIWQAVLELKDAE
jgi:hypothetical protein